MSRERKRCTVVNCRYGRVRCAVCTGTGKCVNCKGRGVVVYKDREVKEEVPCHGCGMTGSCTICRATGTITCGTCGGSGFVS